MRSILLLFLGVPIPFIILIALLPHCAAACCLLVSRPLSGGGRDFRHNCRARPTVPEPLRVWCAGPLGRPSGVGLGMWGKRA